MLSYLNLHRNGNKMSSWSSCCAGTWSEVTEKKCVFSSVVAVVVCSHLEPPKNKTKPPVPVST